MCPARTTKAPDQRLRDMRPMYHVMHHACRHTLSPSSIPRWQSLRVAVPQCHLPALHSKQVKLPFESVDRQSLSAGPHGAKPTTSSLRGSLLPSVAACLFRASIVTAALVATVSHQKASAFRLEFRYNFKCDAFARRSDRSKPSHGKG